MVLMGFSRIIRQSKAAAWVVTGTVGRQTRPGAKARQDHPTGDHRIGVDVRARPDPGPMAGAFGRPEPDILGDGYQALTIELPDDAEGAVVATLVMFARRGCPRRRHRRTRAVLYLHGLVRLLPPDRIGRVLRRPRRALLRAGPAQVRPFAAPPSDPVPDGRRRGLLPGTGLRRSEFIIGRGARSAGDQRSLHRWADRPALAARPAHPHRRRRARQRGGAEQPVPRRARRPGRCARWRPDRSRCWPGTAR